MQRLYSTGEVARLLGIRRHRLDYAIANGYVSPPRTHFLGKRCFSESEIKEIAKYFGLDFSPSKGGVDV